jgi:hypothetical protein
MGGTGDNVGAARYRHESQQHNYRATYRQKLNVKNQIRRNNISAYFL